MNYAVIDLGSNSIRLSVFRYEDTKITTVIQQKEMARLAEYIKDNHLEPEGILKACEVLYAFKKIAVCFVEESNIRVFATASLRGIFNQTQVMKQIWQTTGLLPELLSGEEEARLDFTGASHFTECKDGIMIDIGGASTELIQFENSQPVQVASIPIGCLNLSARFVDKVIPNGEERKKIKKEIREQLGSLGWSGEDNFPLMIGIGGTVRAAHKLSRSLFSLPKEQNEFDADTVKEILQKLKKHENEMFRTVYKLIPERTLTIFTGLMILSEAIKRFGCKSIFVSGYGVREGYFIERILNESGAISADGNYEACENYEFSGLHAEPRAVMAKVQ